MNPINLLNFRYFHNIDESEIFKATILKIMLFKTQIDIIFYTDLFSTKVALTSKTEDPIVRFCKGTSDCNLIVITLYRPAVCKW